MNSLNCSRELLSDIKKQKVLSREENTKLLKLYRFHNDKTALDKLYRGNVRFILQIALRYKYSKIEIGELFNVGSIGFLEGLKAFDMSKIDQISVLTGVVWWIRKEILIEIHNSGVVHVPYQIKGQLNKVKKDLRLVEQGLLSREDILKRHRSLTEEDINMIEDHSFDKGSMYTSHFPEVAVPENEVSIEINSEKILSHIKDKRHRKIFSMRWGLDGCYPKTLEEIGTRLGVTKERIRQIEEVILRDLRPKVLIDLDNII